MLPLSAAERLPEAREPDFFVQARTYWDRIRQNRTVPRKSDFDPVDVPSLLSVTAWVEVMDGGRDYKFRVVGTDIDAIHSGYYTGRRMSEIAAFLPGSPFFEAFAEAVRQGRSVTVTLPYDFEDGTPLHVRVLLLPFGDDEANIDHVWGIILREYSNGACCVPRLRSGGL
jgi:hypothetical protein